MRLIYVRLLVSAVLLAALLVLGSFGRLREEMPARTALTIGASP